MTGFTFEVSTFGRWWQQNTACDAGWIDNECFMRNEELTLNSFCNHVCDRSSIWELVNPLYIVSFCCFYLEIYHVLLNKTCSHLPFLKYVNTRQVFLSVTFLQHRFYHAINSWKCSQWLVVVDWLALGPPEWLGWDFASSLTLHLYSLHEHMRPFKGNLTLYLSRAPFWLSVLVG